MTQNLLRHEASPYLLQHRDNPVHWRPWGPQALAEAERDNKPILLSIGYAACHWCHVMAHESFEDEATAALMNDLFINIKVDREERPEIDQIYMAALHELGEQGGWPLTMFLTPDGSPIWGGTYFPPTPRYGRAGFPDVLREVSRLFHEEPEKIDNNRMLLRERLAARPPTGQIALDADLLDEAARRLLGLMDKERGGVRGAPKFPQASLLEFLWRAGDRSGDPAFQQAVLTTLRNIAQGGITDHVGGGFARYSVDPRWLAPHFEKMLYDNAQLIELMTFAAIATNEPLFRDRIEEAVGWLEREMVQPGGGFAASIDADSEGHEGKFYVWTRDEIIEALGTEEETFFATIYDVTPDGNWEGVSILNRLGHMQPLPQEEEARLERDRATLLARRAERIRPATDDKILTDWNGLAVAALALAGVTFRRRDWIDLGANAFRFIMERMTRDGRLAHSWRAGKALFPGLATDYAAMIKAALALHQATLDPVWIETAEALAATLRRHHWDESTPGYFLPADDAEALIIRPRSATDEATPSANSLMTQNLIRLWHLTGDDAYRADADAILVASGAAVAQNLFAAVGMLSALDLRFGAADVVIIVPAGVSGEDFLRVARRHTTPSTILSLHEDAAKLPAGHPAAGKTTVEGRAAAYVCRGETCSLPVTTPDELATLLSAEAAERIGAGGRTPPR